MSEEAPLHPHRVEEALRVLSELLRDASLKRSSGDNRVVKTSVAALELISKAQKATGITGSVADMGAALLNFMRACGK